MDYPLHILPTIQYKLIEIDLSDFHLMRRFDYRDDTLEIVNALDQVEDKFLFEPTSGFGDLSCSLLGVFTPNDFLVNLTPAGNELYGIYCDGNYNVTVPVHPDHFSLLDDNGIRRHWNLIIGNIKDEKLVFEETITGKKREITCLVLHTPARWNFWHLSIRWLFDDGECYFEKKANKTISDGNMRRVAAAARALLKKNAKIPLPEEYNVINEADYKIG